MSVTARLEQEHERILRLLDVLERLADEPPAPAHDECLDLLRAFADAAHHGKEERCLFPALSAAGLPRHVGPIACMMGEHDMGRAAIGELVSALAARRRGDERGGPRFARAARAYVGLLRGHIAKEDQALFVMARELLPPEAAAFARGPVPRGRPGHAGRGRPRARARARGRAGGRRPRDALVRTPLT